MKPIINSIIIENFKSYQTRQIIPLSSVSGFLGANSSGKSTALQPLLVLKQTLECNSNDIDLLLAGKYVTIGGFDDAINRSRENASFKLGLTTIGNENYSSNEENNFIWEFKKDEKKHGSVKLQSINLSIDNITASFEWVENDFYRIYINNVYTPYLVKINHLSLMSFYLEYDNILNDLFCDLFHSLSSILFSKKNAPAINRHNVMSFDGYNEFLFALIQAKAPSSIPNLTEPSDKLNIAKKVSELITKYMLEQCHASYTTLNIPGIDSLALFLMAAIEDENCINDIERIVIDYDKKLTEYQNHKDSSDKDWRRISVTSYLRTSSNTRIKGDNLIENINRIHEEYHAITKLIINCIYYLGPIREKPRGLYNIGFETIPKYVGPSGAFFSSVLMHENRYANYVLPDIFQNSDYSERGLLSEALNRWLYHLDIASRVDVQQSGSLASTVTVSNMNNNNSDLLNVGIGTSQILPVLIMGLLSQKDDILLFEQPELHLHPYSQSRLSDFFVALAKSGRRVIVETHSEYLLLRLRLHVLKNNIDPNSISVSFFENTGSTTVSKCELNGYGEFNYPNGFKDTTQDLINDLMYAALNKG